MKNYQIQIQIMNKISTVLIYIFNSSYLRNFVILQFYSLFYSFHFYLNIY